MPIKIVDVTSPALQNHPSGPFGVNLYLAGDGSSTSFSVDLAKNPVNINFGNNPPDAVFAFTGPDFSTSVVSATTLQHGTIVTVTLNDTLGNQPISANGSVRLAAAYNV